MSTEQPQSPAVAGTWWLGPRWIDLRRQPVAALAPVEQQRRANRWLLACREEARRRAVLPARLAGLDLDLLDAMKSPLNLSNGVALTHAGTLAGLAAGHPGRRLWLTGAPPGLAAAARSVRRAGLPTHVWAPSEARQRWRVRLYRAREGWRRRLQDARRPAAAAPGEVGAPVVLVPRTSGHLLDHLATARALQARQVAVMFAPATTSVSAPGFPQVGLMQLGAGLPPHHAERRRLQASLCDAIRAAGASAGELSAAERSALVDSSCEVVADNLALVLRAAAGAERLIAAWRPRAIVVGNPYTPEGRTVALVARGRGVPTAALEHGSIFADDPIWSECPVDRVCAWGQASRRALLTCGVPEAAIAVTGAPRLDEVVGRWTADGPPKILVATSGPGDQVPLAQHQDFIDALYRAAAACPEVPFVVKLHRKDPAALYEQAARRHGFDGVRVLGFEPGRFGLDIFEHLRGARALITIYSTTAVDAMLVGVPVITYVPGAQHPRVEFLARGATRQVGDWQGLAAEVRRAWTREPVPAVDAAAAAYAAEHFSALGSGAANVAEELLRLDHG